MIRAVIRTVLLFGGRSAEHEVSILSARSVANAASKERIEIVPICVARDGRFVDPEKSAQILAGEERSDAGHAGFSFETWSRTQHIDVVFPLIHGTGGEDGTLQGYLEMLGLPYVGSGVTASAIGMDKVHMKQAFAAAKLPMIESVAVHERDWHHERDRERAAAAVLRQAGEQRIVSRRDEGEERPGPREGGRARAALRREGADRTRRRRARDRGVGARQ